MTDIATLGFAVDTSGLKAAESALDDVTKSADQTAASAKKAGDSLGDVGKQGTNVSAGLNPATQATDRFALAQKNATATMAASAAQIRSSFGINDQLNASQVKVIRGLEDQVAAQALSGQALATYTALRKAGTSADSEAGKVISDIVALQYAGTAATNSWRNAWGLLGPSVTGTTGALGANASAARGVESAHLGTSAASRELGLELRALTPVLGQAGIATAGLGQFAWAARGGLLGFAAAITGTVIVALESASDALRHFQLDLSGFGGSQATGTVALAGLRAASDQSNLSLSTLAGSFGQLLLAQQKYQAQQGVVLVPGAASAVDAITKVEKAFGDMGRIADASDATIAKVATTIATSLATSGTLTAQAFNQVIAASPAMAAAIAKAYNGQTVAQFMQTVASGQVTYAKFIDAIGRAEPALRQQAEQTIPGMTRAWDDLKAAWERYEQSAGSGNTVSAFLQKTAKSLDEVTNGTKTWGETLWDLIKEIDQVTAPPITPWTTWSQSVNDEVQALIDKVKTLNGLQAGQNMPRPNGPSGTPDPYGGITDPYAKKKIDQSVEVGNLGDWQKFYAQLDQLDKQRVATTTDTTTQITTLWDASAKQLWNDFNATDLFNQVTTDTDKNTKLISDDWSQAGSNSSAAWQKSLQDIQNRTENSVGVVREQTGQLGSAFDQIPNRVAGSFGQVPGIMQADVGAGVNGSIALLDRLIQAANAAARAEAGVGAGAGGNAGGSNSNSSNNTDSLLPPDFTGGYAEGGVGTVPDGFPNDSYRATLNVESGERIIIVPRTKTINDVLREKNPIHLGSFSDGGVASFTPTGVTVQPANISQIDASITQSGQALLNTIQQAVNSTVNSTVNSITAAPTSGATVASAPTIAESIAPAVAAAVPPAASPIASPSAASYSAAPTSTIADAIAPAQSAAIGTAAPAVPSVSLTSNAPPVGSPAAPTGTVPGPSTGQTTPITPDQSVMNASYSFQDFYAKLGITPDSARATVTGAGNNDMKDVIRLGTIQTVGAIKLSQDTLVTQDNQATSQIVAAINAGTDAMTNAVNSTISSGSASSSSGNNSSASSAGGLTVGMPGFGMLANGQIDLSTQGLLPGKGYYPTTATGAVTGVSSSKSVDPYGLQSTYNGPPLDAFGRPLGGGGPITGTSAPYIPPPPRPGAQVNTAPPAGTGNVSGPGSVAYQQQLDMWKAFNTPGVPDNPWSGTGGPDPFGGIPDYNYADGGSFIVPPGYPNDTFNLARFTSGERVTVEPASSVMSSISSSYIPGQNSLVSNGPASYSMGGPGGGMPTIDPRALSAMSWSANPSAVPTGALSPAVTSLAAMLWGSNPSATSTAPSTASKLPASYGAFTSSPGAASIASLMPKLTSPAAYSAFSMADGGTLLPREGVVPQGYANDSFKAIVNLQQHERFRVEPHNASQNQSNANGPSSRMSSGGIRDVHIHATDFDSFVKSKEQLRAQLNRDLRDNQRHF